MLLEDEDFRGAIFYAVEKKVFKVTEISVSLKKPFKNCLKKHFSVTTRLQLKKKIKNK